MTKKYMAVRMPVEAYKKIIVKKVRLEKVGSKLIGKPVTIPLTRVFKVMAENPIVLPDDIVKNLFRKRKK